MGDLKKSAIDDHDLDLSLGLRPRLNPNHFPLTTSFKRKSQNDVVIGDQDQERRRKVVNMGFESSSFCWGGDDYGGGGSRLCEGQNGKFVANNNNNNNNNNNRSSVSSESCSSGFSESYLTTSSNAAAAGGNNSDTSSNSSQHCQNLPTLTTVKQTVSSQEDDTLLTSSKKITLTNNKEQEASPTIAPTPTPLGASQKVVLGKPPKPNRQMSQKSVLLPQMPCVTATGNGADGKTITGFLYKYSKTEVNIVCVCHGSSFSPSGFVEHAGGVDIKHPLKHIRVVPFALT